MNRGKTSVRVTILGDEYTLRSATSAEETQAIAEQVDQSIREIMQSGLVVETHKAAILACLRMAGELAQAHPAPARSGARTVRPTGGKAKGRPAPVSAAVPVEASPAMGRDEDGEREPGSTEVSAEPAEPTATDVVSSPAEPVPTEGDGQEGRPTLDAPSGEDAAAPAADEAPATGKNIDEAGSLFDL